MAMRPFLKMHGLGNDFVVFDARSQPITVDARLARAIADRRTGIGCDQLIVIEPSAVATVRARFWNSDGGEVSACGNGSRAVAALLGGAASIETGGGVLAAGVDGATVTIDMGTPRFEWDAVPLALAMDTRDMPVGWDGLERPGAVNVGNPHVVFFVGDPAAIDLERLGPVIERDPLFPERINVGVAGIVARDNIVLRVWERGAGLTRACGTGAVAAFAVARRRGLVDAKATVTLPGGDLVITAAADGHLLMSGPAVVAFRGEIDLEAL